MAEELRAQDVFCPRNEVIFPFLAFIMNECTNQGSGLSNP